MEEAANFVQRTVKTQRAKNFPRQWNVLKDVLQAKVEGTVPRVRISQLYLFCSVLHNKSENKENKVQDLGEFCAFKFS